MWRDTVAAVREQIWPRTSDKAVCETDDVPRTTAPRRTTSETSHEVTDVKRLQLLNGNSNSPEIGVKSDMTCPRVVCVVRHDTSLVLTLENGFVASANPLLKRSVRQKIPPWINPMYHNVHYLAISLAAAILPLRPVIPFF